MAQTNAKLFSATGESKGTVELPQEIFGAIGSRRILHETIVALQANQRRGTSATKTRGLVSGGGHKPWKQKGTGNARSGSNRSPLWRKGGIIFGPSPRSYRIDLPAQKKQVALQSALAAKGIAEQILIIEKMASKESKTRDIYAILKKVGLKGKMLIVLDKKEPQLVRAIRNVGNTTLVDALELNPLHLLMSKNVLMTSKALEALKARIQEG